MDIRGANPSPVAMPKPAAVSPPPQSAAVPPGATVPAAQARTVQTPGTQTQTPASAAPAAASSAMGFLDMARAAQPTVATGPLNSSFGFGSDGFGFDDVIDAINPLQHIPVVSTIYRALTGDTIDATPRMIGGAIFGGPLGFALAAVDSAIEDSTGKDTEGHVMAALFGEPETTPREPVQFAAGGAQANSPQSAPDSKAVDSTMAAAVAGAAAQASAGPGAWYMASAMSPSSDSPPDSISVAAAPAVDTAMAPAAGPAIAPAAAPAAQAATDLGNAAPAPDDANALIAGNHPLTKAQLELLGQGGVPGTGLTDNRATRDGATTDGEIVPSAVVAKPDTVAASANPQAAVAAPLAPANPSNSSAAPAPGPASSAVDLTPDQLTLLLKSVGIDPSTVPEAAADSSGDGEKTTGTAGEGTNIANTTPPAPPATTTPAAFATPSPAATDPVNAPVAPVGTLRNQAAIGTTTPIPTAISRDVPFTARTPANAFEFGGIRDRGTDPSIAQKMQRGLDSYLKNRTALNPHPLTIDTTQ